MTQRDRDRLVALKKARKGLITQRQAAEEIGQSERHIRRLLNRLRGKGDAALVHALRGRRSNRTLDETTKQKALEILGRDVYRGFGPTLAAEYLASKHDVHAGRETVRSWMVEGKLWHARHQHIDKIHQWRPRRSRVGELVQWDTSEHACPGWKRPVLQMDCRWRRTIATETLWLSKISSCRGRLLQTGTSNMFPPACLPR